MIRDTDHAKCVPVRLLLLLPLEKGAINVLFSIRHLYYRRCLEDWAEYG